MVCEELSSPTQAPIRFYLFNFDEQRGQQTKMTWIRFELPQRSRKLTWHRKVQGCLAVIEIQIKHPQGDAVRDGFRNNYF